MPVNQLPREQILLHAEPLRTLTVLEHLPPVPVKLSVSKAQQLSHEVQRGVEEPVEKHQPQQVIRNLKRRRENAREQD